MKNLFNNIEERILITLSLIMSWGALVYYLYQLNNLGVIISLTLTVASGYILIKKIPVTTKRSKEKEDISEDTRKKLFINYQKKLLLLPYLIIWIFNLYILFNNSSAEAIISPWTKIPYYFFIFFTVSTIYLIFLLRKKYPQYIKLNLIRLHYLLSFSIAIIIYKIGYGFDPFIHQATIELIDKNGMVSPKPLYYLGQYSLITILHKISGVSIFYLNKFLIPVLSAIFLPTALFKFIKEKNNSIAMITVIGLLIIPFNIFILSTPQNLSYLFLILLVLYNSFSYYKITPIMLSLAIMSLHPLSGIPAFLFLAFNYLEKIKIKNTYKKFLNIIIFIATVIAIPAAFIFLNKQSLANLNINFKINLFNNILNNTNQSDLVLNFIYFLNNIIPLTIIILIINGYLLYRKKTSSDSEKFKNEEINYLKKLSILPKISLALLISFLISRSLDFSFLISYEQNNYSDRILIIVIIFLLPFIIVAINSLIGKIYDKQNYLITSGIIIISLFISASLYNSYPRFDPYFNSRGFSLSGSDLDAVKLIDQQTNEPYIVLANQQTSVAALKELGFDNYLNVKGEKIFFYPIPTSGELYKYYLKMVNNKLDKEIIKEAMDLCHVSRAYFIINKYWWQSDKIIAEAKIEATNYWSINKGDIFVFEFIR